MSEISILKEMNPTVAGFIESWKSKYERKFDLSDVEQQAIFYEAMLELARFVAKTSDHAALSCELCTEGISQVKLLVKPHA